MLQTRSILQSAARYGSMANGNFPYHTDQFHSFTYSPAFYSSGPSYSQNQQLPVFYPSQTDSQQFSQAFHPPQNDLQQFSAESERSAGSTSKAPAKKNTRDRWDSDDEKVLMQLWGIRLRLLKDAIHSPVTARFSVAIQGRVAAFIQYLAYVIGKCTLIVLV